MGGICRASNYADVDLLGHEDLRNDNFEIVVVNKSNSKHSSPILPNNMLGEPVKEHYAHDGRGSPKEDHDRTGCRNRPNAIPRAEDRSCGPKESTISRKKHLIVQKFSIIAWKPPCLISSLGHPYHGPISTFYDHSHAAACVRRHAESLISQRLGAGKL